jgi:hypothetical protein
VARLGRRQVFKPIIQGLIKYQPAAGEPPEASKPTVVSFESVLMSGVARRQSYPRGRSVITNGLIRFAAIGSQAPSAHAPYLFTQIANATANIRGHALHQAILGLPIVIAYTPPAVVTTWTFSHNLQEVDPRVRKAIGQMSAMLNNLLRTGQLRGTINEPSLGYLGETQLNWQSGDMPLTTNEAIDRIAAALAALGQKP